DHVLAATEPRAAHPLPPGQHGLAEVTLDTEVARALTGRHRVVPDEAAVGIDDHRAVRYGSVPRGQEDVAGEPPMPRHAYGGRLQVGARVKTEHVAADAGSRTRTLVLDAPCRIGDREVEVSFRGSPDVQRRRHGHRLARGERDRGQEAGTAAIGVAPKSPGVKPA